MTLTRIPPAARVRGTLVAPPDKSISHRGALVSLLSTQTTILHNYLTSADTLATLSALQTLGARVKRHQDTVEITGLGLNTTPHPADILDARNSGTLARIILGVLAGYGCFACMTGDESLRRRPMGRVIGPLGEMGAEIRASGGGELLPLAVLGGGLRGGEVYTGVASAQVKSALLFGGLFADGGVTVVGGGGSRDHTERILGVCGVPVSGGGDRVGVEPVERIKPPREMVVPGDFSSAAFWVSAAAIIPGSRLRITGVGINPTRTGFLDILRRMGAEVEVESRGEGSTGEPIGDIAVSSGGLTGIRVGAEDVPGAVDELPLLALLGAFCEGETVVEGASELRVKESDRIGAVCREFGKIGVEIEEREDGFVVGGGGSGIEGGRVHSGGDHRLAMGLAVAGLASREGVEIEGMEDASVSYPGFVRDLERVVCW